MPGRRRRSPALALLRIAVTAAQALSDAQLEEIFKRTSTFTVRSAMRPGANLYEDDDDFVEALLNADEGDEE